MAGICSYAISPKSIACPVYTSYSFLRASFSSKSEIQRRACNWSKIQTPRRSTIVCSVVRNRYDLPFCRIQRKTGRAWKFFFYFQSLSSETCNNVIARFLRLKRDQTRYKLTHICLFSYVDLFSLVCLTGQVNAIQTVSRFVSF